VSVYPAKIGRDERDALAAIYADPRKFFQLLQVWDKKTKGWVDFVLNEEQELLLDALLAHNRIIVLKARQIGVSTLVRAYAFWKTFTSETPVRWGTLSFTRDSATNLQAMDRGFYDRLPPVLTKHRKLDSDSKTALRFKDTGASTAVFTASSKYGTRSFALSDAHISEFAFYDNPDELLATVLATVEDGQIVIESTPNQRGDAYHRRVQMAADGSNGWKLVTFWWWEHRAYRSNPPADFVPTAEEEAERQKYGLNDAQLYWRRQMVQSMGLTKFRREYPGCMADAFAAAEGSYFRDEELSRIAELQFDGPEMVVDKPRQGEVYVVGVDVGGGVGGDYSALTVVTASTRQVVYQWRSNTVSPAAFAAQVVDVASKYNQALVLVESNNHGHVTLLRLQDYGYGNLWLSNQGKPWVTTASSKVAAYESLREFVTEGFIRHLPDVTLDELRSLHAKGLAPEAPSGLHDDLAVSLALAYYCLRSVPQAAIVSAKQARVDTLLSGLRANRLMSSNLPWRVNS